MRENTDQKKSEYKHFPRSDNLSSKSGFTHHYTEIANIELLMQNLTCQFSILLRAYFDWYNILQNVRFLKRYFRLRK